MLAVFAQEVLVDEISRQKRAARVQCKSGERHLCNQFERVGILDRKPLFVCKYFMVGKHWQIIRRSRQGKVYEGQSETLPVEIAPKKVIRAALKAADLIGDGLYGVDVKEINGNATLIEINDNPTIEAGTEDFILKDDLYLRIMEVFLRRIERAKERNYRT